MLEFTHRSAENEKSLHIWPYVYFHGEAERMNDKAFAEGGDAPDISIANEPMENYMLMKTWMGIAWNEGDGPWGASYGFALHSRWEACCCGACDP